MKIAVRAGHNYGVRGASGYIDEVDEDRKYYKSVIKYLQSAGHEVIDCTPERTDTQSQDLSYGVSKANFNGVDLFVSCHMNCYNGTAQGCEVFYTSNTGREYATKVSNGIAALGFKNRGAKYSSSYYELNHTNMPAIIVEPLFVDYKTDVDLYKNIGFDELGFVIAKAIDPNVTKPTVPTTPSAPSEPSVPSGTIGMVTASVLNVRSGAGTNYSVIGTIEYGRSVKIDKVVGDWYSIFYGEHGGYVSKKYIKI